MDDFALVSFRCALVCFVRSLILQINEVKQKHHPIATKQTVAVKSIQVQAKKCNYYVNGFSFHFFSYTYKSNYSQLAAVRTTKNANSLPSRSSVELAWFFFSHFFCLLHFKSVWKLAKNQAKN